MSLKVSFWNLILSQLPFFSWQIPNFNISYCHDMLAYAIDLFAAVCLRGIPRGIKTEKTSTVHSLPYACLPKDQHEKKIYRFQWHPRTQRSKDCKDHKHVQELLLVLECHDECYHRLPCDSSTRTKRFKIWYLNKISHSSLFLLPTHKNLRAIAISKMESFDVSLSFSLSILGSSLVLNHQYSNLLLEYFELSKVLNITGFHG